MIKVVAIAILALFSVSDGGEDQLENGMFSARLNGFEIQYEVRGSGPVCMVMPVSWGMGHEGMRGFLRGMRGFLRGLEDHLTMVYFDPRGVGGSEEVRTDEDRSMAPCAKRSLVVWPSSNARLRRFRFAVRDTGRHLQEGC